MPIFFGESYDPITLEDDEFLMVYGVNHVLTGKATYQNVNAYATGRDNGGSEPESGDNVVVGSVFDDELSGTAKVYLPDDPDANLMYAYKISRNCAPGELRCLQLSAPCARLTLDSKTVLGFYIRMYVEPATKVGAAMPEILYDRILKFSPRK